MVRAKCGAFVHAMCVLVWGGVRRLFCPAFLKAGEMFPKGNGFTFFLFLQKEPKSMLPRQGQTSCLSGSSRRGRFYVLFASTKRTKSSPEGCDPLDSEGRFKTLQNIFSCCFRLSSLNRYVVRPAFSDVLNRCERVAVVQTQDRYFSKMGYCTASSQGRMYSKMVAARYLGCGGNLKF